MENEDKDKIISDLKTENENLHKEISSLFKEVFILNGIIKSLNKENDKQTISQLRNQLKKFFESSTEKQPLLFNDFETTVENGALEETPEEETVEVGPYTRKKARKSVSLPADTPVIDIYDDSEITTCPRCGSPMERVGEKIYESFTKICHTAIVRKHVGQFECTKCEPENEGERITQTPVTSNMMDGTVCDPTLLSQIVENKFSYAQPLYRQALEFKNIGLSRFTMSAWLMKVGTRLEENMAPCLEKLIYSYPLINMDETPLKVLGLTDDDGKKKAPHSKANAFMIVRAATDKNGKKGPVLFTYTDNRKNQTLIDVLKTYNGVVQTDGLYGYDNAAEVCDFTHIDCVVHARRKAITACDKRTSGPAYELVKLYEKFFHEEGKLKDEYDEKKFTDEEYLVKRKEKLLPALNNIKAFCEKNVDDAIGSFKIACKYPLTRWDTLTRFLDYPYATSSNQKAENAIRPFCLGKKNWLFCITETGADVSAFFYSLVESCKSMDINFQDYMTYVLLNANTIKDGDVEAWTNMLPGKCDISSVKAYREKLFSAKPDPNRTKPYVLRGKRV